MILDKNKYFCENTFGDKMMIRRITNMNETHSKKPKRVFTPEQKYEILKDIER
jgi:hypothetical protein